MSHNRTPILTSFSPVHSAENHFPSIGYFLFDKPEDIPDIPRFYQNATICVDLSQRSPIDSLPNEILSHIFESGYFEGEDLNLHFRALIEKISPRWRDTARRTPSLWSTFHLSQGNVDQFIGLIPQFLKRSGDYPLDIHLNCFWDPSRTREVMTYFLPHSQRWRTLSITMPGAEVFRYLHNAPAPRLQTLEICHFSSQRFLPIDPGLFDNHLTLRHLTLRNVSLKATTLPLKFLQSLDIRGYGVWPEREELEELIGGSTELRNLTLHVRPRNALGDINPQDDQSSQPILLPSLRFFNVITSEGLSPGLATLSRLFSSPSLDTFTVKDGSILTTRPIHDIVRYSRTGSARYPNSPSLHIKKCSLYHAWRSLSSSRSITMLELDDVHWPHWSNCMTVFAGLPHLQTMIISNVDTSTALSELGNPPYPLKTASLKRLEVGFTRHKCDVVESDFAKFVSTFDAPQLHALSVRDISWQQWSSLVLAMADRIKSYPALVSLTLTNLHGLKRSLPDPSLAFPDLQDLTLIRTATSPLLGHLNPILSLTRVAASWPKLRNLTICGDPQADVPLLCQIVASRPECPLSLLLDSHFCSDLESWSWLKGNADVALIHQR